MGDRIFLEVIVALIVRRAQYCSHLAIAAHYGSIHTIKLTGSVSLATYAITAMLVDDVIVGAAADASAEHPAIEDHRRSGHKDTSVGRIEGDVRVDVGADLLELVAKSGVVEIVVELEVTHSGINH